MRTNLAVPFAEKDEAKKLGARWDAARKTWYVDGKPDVSAFSKWIKAAPEGSIKGDLAGKSPSANQVQAAGIRVVGKDYIGHPRVCECLPWDECDQCRPLAISR